VVERIEAGHPYRDVEQARLLRLAARANQARGAHGDRSAQTEDAVEISSQAAQIQPAAETVSQAPDVRQDVVDKLRDDISSGTYKVDAHAIARTIIDLLA